MTGAFLTMVYVPVLYSLFDQMQERLQRVV